MLLLLRKDNHIHPLGPQTGPKPELPPLLNDPKDAPPELLRLILLFASDPFSSNPYSGSNIVIKNDFIIITVPNLDFLLNGLFFKDFETELLVDDLVTFVCDALSQ